MLELRRSMALAFLLRRRDRRSRGDHAMAGAALVGAMLALLLIGGCAKTTVSDRQYYEGPRLARPARVIVITTSRPARPISRPGTMSRLPRRPLSRRRTT